MPVLCLPDPLEEAMPWTGEEPSVHGSRLADSKQADQMRTLGRVCGGRTLDRPARQYKRKKPDQPRCRARVFSAGFR